MRSVTFCRERDMLLKGSQRQSTAKHTCFLYICPLSSTNINATRQQSTNIISVHALHIATLMLHQVLELKKKILLALVVQWVLFCLNRLFLNHLYRTITVHQ